MYIKERLHYKLMIFILTLTIIPFASFTGPVQAAFGDNLISDPSFEVGTNNAAQYVSNVSQTDVCAKTGTKSLKVTQTSTYGGVDIPVALEQRKTYSFSLWLRLDPASVGGRYFYMGYNVTNETAKYVRGMAKTATRISNSGEWTQFTGYLTVYEAGGAINNTNIHIYLNPDSGDGTFTFYVDDIELKEVAAPKVTANSITNGTIIPVEELPNPIIQFDADMDITKFNTTNIVETTGIINQVITNSDDKKTCILKLDRTKIKRDTDYIIVLDNLSDINGNIMGKIIMRFKTGGYPATDKNHIYNANMEDPNGYISHTNSNISYIEDTFHSGQKALKVEQTAINGSASLPVYMKAAGNYYFSTWVRLSDNMTAKTKILCELSTGNNQKTYMTSIIGASDGYVQLNGIFTVPNGDTPNGSVQYMKIYASPAEAPNDKFTFQIDDVQFKQISTLPPLPEISNVTPADGASKVELDTNITLSFKTDMNVTTLVKGNIKVNGSVELIQEIIATSDNPKLCTVKLNQVLSEGTAYTISVTGLKDIYGQLVADKMFTFYTKRIVDTTNIAINNSFEDTSMNASEFAVNCATSYTSDFHHSGNNSLKVVQLASQGNVYLPSAFKMGRSYKYSAWLKLDATIVGTKTFKAYYTYKYNNETVKELINSSDLIDSNMGWKEITGTFCADENIPVTELGVLISVDGTEDAIYYLDDITVEEVDLPIMISTAPEHREQSADVLSDLVLNFDCEIDTATLTKENIFEETGKILVNSIDFGLGSPQYTRICYVRLPKMLPENTAYQFVVKNVKDKFGNIMPDRIIRFKTEVVVTPSIESVNPSNNASGANFTDLTMTVVFSQQMNASTFTKDNIHINGSDLLIDTINLNSSDKKTCTILFKTLNSGSLYEVSFNNLKSLKEKTLPNQTSLFLTKENKLTSIINASGFESESDNLKLSYSNTTGTVTTSEKHSGNSSIYINQSKEYGTVVLNTTTPIVSGKSYYYSFWYKLPPNTSDQKLKLWLNFTSGAQDSKIIVSQPYVAESRNRFINVRGTVDMKAPLVLTGKTISTITLMLDEPTGGGSYYLDDIEFIEIPSVTSGIDLTRTFPPQVDADIDSDKIYLSFIDDIDLSTLTKENIKINGSTDLIESVDILLGYQRTCIVKLAKSLNYNTSYKVSLNNIKDIGQRSLNNTEYEFKTQQRYQSLGCKVYAGGEEITKLQAGTIQVVISDVKNNTGKDNTITLLAALYKNNVLYDIYNSSALVGKNSFISGDVVNVALDVPDITSGTFELRVFRIDSMNTLQTFANSIYVLR